MKPHLPTACGGPAAAARLMAAFVERAGLPFERSHSPRTKDNQSWLLSVRKVHDGLCHTARTALCRQDVSMHFCLRYLHIIALRDTLTKALHLGWAKRAGITSSYEGYRHHSLNLEERTVHGPASFQSVKGKHLKASYTYQSFLIGMYNHLVKDWAQDHPNKGNFHMPIPKNLTFWHLNVQVMKLTPIFTTSSRTLARVCVASCSSRFLAASMLWAARMPAVAIGAPGATGIGGGGKTVTMCNSSAPCVTAVFRTAH